MTNETKEKKLKTASVLAFESKLANSDAIMMAGNWENINNANKWSAIRIQEKSVRGTISNRLKSSDPKFKDPAKLDAEVTKANLQTVDNAALPFDTDSLKVSFTLRVLGDVVTPSACNDPDYQEKLSETIAAYIEVHQFNELANRYAINIANGRFLWRNRVCAEKIEVHVKLDKEVIIFDAYQNPLNEFISSDEMSDDLKKLASSIQKGLTDKAYSFMKVDTFVKLGQGQMVYPSQEMVMKGGSGEKSKYLYQLDDVAAMHSQKIGNALRTIDTWYSEAETVGPIAIEPYGSVTNRGKAYRSIKNGDFYSLLDNWILKDKTPEVEQQHYVMAVLVRGGVFGDSGKE
ncbi:MAG: type I-F CRISPR-associated protein Csy3 [Pseudomonadales bacterium]|nr:type I-F CRISPR-associated protein Csy3 [Pseudomonadales bacterium]